MLRCKSISLVGLSLCLLWSMPLTAQPSLVDLPVSGRFVYIDNGNKLVQLDTHAETTTILDQSSGYIDNPYFTEDGASLLYMSTGYPKKYSFIDNTMRQLETFSGYDGVFTLLGTVSDTKQYYRFSDWSQGTPPTSTRLLSKSPGSTIQNILEIPDNTILDDLPLPATITRLRFDHFMFFEHNPVYDDWFIVGISATNPDDTLVFGSEIQEKTLRFTYLWNVRASEWVLIEKVTGADGDNQVPVTATWSPDGQHIATVYNEEAGSTLYILSFDPLKGIIHTVKSASADARPAHWLGVGDLLITTRVAPDYSTLDIQVYIGQIVDHTWYEREFFQLHQADTTPSDWYLTADEHERYKLSCLFDLALPQHLVTGATVSVMQRQAVLAAPNPEAVSIGALSMGDYVTITGTSACTDHTRWWQITTASHGVGWVMEADRTHYYLQSMSGFEQES